MGSRNPRRITTFKMYYTLLENLLMIYILKIAKGELNESNFK